jgi:hypothetical protein
LLPLKSKQTPGAGEIFLDHVGWYVPNLNAVVSCFSRLGFVITPFSVQGDRDPQTGEVVPQGSANRLVMLGSGYLEFLTVIKGADTPVSRHLQDRIDKYIGVHLVAFTVDDAEAEAKRIKLEGVDLQPTVNLRRRVEAEDGSNVEAAFSVIRAQFDLYPEGRVQTLTQHTPEYLWQDRYISLENGIYALDEVIYAVPDPLDSATRFAQFTGRSLTRSKIGAHIMLDRGKLIFATAQSLRKLIGLEVLDGGPSIAAIGLLSKNLTKTAKFFHDQKIEHFVHENNTLRIMPGGALGTTLIISSN